MEQINYAAAAAATETGEIVTSPLRTGVPSIHSRHKDEFAIYRKIAALLDTLAPCGTHLGSDLHVKAAAVVRQYAAGEIGIDMVAEAVPYSHAGWYYHMACSYACSNVEFRMLTDNERVRRARRALKEVKWAVNMALQMQVS